jgi:DNA gyrase subunit A
MMTVDDSDEIVVVSTDGIVIRTAVKDIRTIGRNTQGVKIMTPTPGAKVSAVARAVTEDKEDSVSASVEGTAPPGDAEPSDDEPANDENGESDG